MKIRIIAAIILCATMAHSRIMEGGYWPAPRITGGGGPNTNIGYALLFDGNDYAAIAGTNAALSADDITFSFWAKLTGTTYQFPLGYGDSSAVRLRSISYSFNNNRRIGLYWGSSGSSYHEWAATNVLTAGVWTHFCISQSGTNLPLIYIDGQVKAASMTQAAGTNNLPTVQPFAIGRPGAYNGLYFRGGIDDVAVWWRVLSSSEVATVYSTTLSAAANVANAPWNDSLAALWRLDENTGTSIGSAAATNYSGAITGAAWTNGVVCLP